LVFNISCGILGPIAHNVPVVCDGLTARIEKCVVFLGLANCAGAGKLLCGNIKVGMSEAIDLAVAETEPPIGF
jgi:hypothetical protein